jgi:hypothetical protein
MSAFVKYLWYIFKHKFYVYQEARALKVGRWQALIHDWSKFLPVEFRAYCNFFERRKKTGPHLNAFKRAWLHHIHQNPHHWQHYVLVNDDGSREAVEIPEKYVREMLADWRGMRRTLGMNPDGGQIWYQAHRDSFVFHPKTRQLLEELLELPHAKRLSYVGASHW